MFNALRSGYGLLFPNAASLFGDVKSIFQYSAGILKKYRRILFKVSLLKTVSFPLGLSIVYIAKVTLDKGIWGKDLRVFLWLTVLGFLVFLLTKLLQYLGSKAVLKVKAKFSQDINCDLTKRLLGLNYLKIRELSSSENAFILNYDYHVIEGLIFDQIPSLVSLVKVPVLLAMVFVFSMPLSLLIFVTLPFIAVHTVWASRASEKYRTRMLYHSRKHGSLLHDILLNVKLVKSFHKEDWALGRITSSYGTKTKKSLEYSLFSHMVNLISGILIRFNTFIFWLLGGYFIIKGRLSFGSFSAILMYSAMIISEIYNLGGFIRGLNEERSAIRRNAVFIGKISEKVEKPDLLTDAKGVPLFDGDIEFRNITFGYKGERLLLKNLSFIVPGRKWTLVKGISGVGKTSLLSLFLRLFSASGGDILIGGRNIESIARSDYFKNVSVVHQQPYLFNDTVVNNILLGEDKSKSDIEKALFCAKIGELRSGFSCGYNRGIGEFGACLSGGEGQRVAIARALVRDPKILVLDEATSYIDIDMEKEIFENIKENFPSLTVIFVTHRDTAENFADEIFLLENGCILKEDKINLN